MTYFGTTEIKELLSFKISLFSVTFLYVALFIYETFFIIA